MRLADLWQRAIPPEPWQEGDNIPWNDPAFSARMLDEHLSQAHDAASRRSATIDRQVAWIQRMVLRGDPTAILDLGCGPGLYTSRLARLGHTCVGIDFSPAAIAYARATADGQQLACDYRLEDLRSAVFGSGFGLVMCVFGEINVFPREQANALLRKAYDALDCGGLLLLEAHTSAAIEQIGERTPSWFTAASGLFGVTPHLCLMEHFWHAEAQAATTRYYVIELATDGLTRYAQSFQAYTQPEYAELLQGCGFDDVVFYPALTGALEPEQPNLFVVVARKPAGASVANEHRMATA
ncbi:MAG TPA: class I SAM-dependent methyltransferase [Roseiflexaceae bacterium]|nr:class I SAM-dependent methyltransferase [Roseiflexaceae bacterium]